MATSSEVLAFLAQRRSYGLKEVSPEPIERSAIELILQAATLAPSHGVTEPWRFVVYSGEARAELGAALVAAAQGDPFQEAKQRDKVWMAPVWIALGMQPQPKNPEWEELAAVAMAVQNAHLMAAHLGLAAKWSSGPIGTHEIVAKTVGFAAPTKLLGFLYVGKPAVTPKPLARSDWQSKTTWKE